MIRKDRLIIRYAESVNLGIQHGGYIFYRTYYYNFKTGKINDTFERSLRVFVLMRNDSMFLTMFMSNT